MQTHPWKLNNWKMPSLAKSIKSEVKTCLTEKTTKMKVALACSLKQINNPRLLWQKEMS